MIHNIRHMPHVIPIGIQTETGVEAIGFDVKPWLDEYDGLTITVWPTRPGEGAAYPAADVKLVGTVLYWTPNATDTAIQGVGRVEILGVADGKRKLSGWCETIVRGTSLDTTQKTPDAMKVWVDEVILAGANAVAATKKMPSISDHGTWMMWDEAAGAYVDTGKPSQGEPGPKGDRGPEGDQGHAATVKVGSVTTLPAGSYATVKNSGTDIAVVLDFGIPRGADGAGGSGSGEAGENGGYYKPTVEDGILSWLPSKADMPPVSDADIRGPQGPAGERGLPGETGPKGDPGSDGNPGKAATIRVGTVTTLAPGSYATVTNTGTETEAVFNFGIPQGASGQGGGGSGESGENGGFYIPDVSSEGLLSWSPSKADMPIVPSVNIRGPKGDTGSTGDTGPAGSDGAPGKDGTSVTVASVNTSSEDGGSNVVTFSDGKTLTVKNGSKGRTGDQGHAGSDGAPGKDGTSVTVASVSTSSADGGSNVVTFSDGKTVTVKNGSKGSTPVKGTDYYTEAEKAELVTEVSSKVKFYATATIGTTWEGSGPYTQTVAVSGMLASDTPIIDLLPSADLTTAEAELEAWSMIYRIDTAADSITVYASEATTQAITIQILGVR